MYINLSGNCSVAELLGYVPVFYTDRIFPSMVEERDAIQAEIANVTRKEQQAGNKAAVAGFLLPGLYFRYRALQNSYKARLKVLQNALITVNAQATPGAQAAREVRVLTQAITPDTSLQAIQTAQDLLRQAEARQIVEDASVKKPNMALAFIIPAAAGAVAGFFL